MEFSFGFVNARKGQMAIEFILIVILMLLYIQTIILPSISIAEASVDDSTRVAQARFAAERLSSTLAYVDAVNGASRKTINIYVPGDTSLKCDVSGADNTVSFTVKLNEELANRAVPLCTEDADGWKCSKEFSIPDSVSTCGSGAVFDLQVRGLYSIRVEKDAGTGEVSAILVT